MDAFTQQISKQLRELALALPETTEGTSCVNRAFRVGRKNFMFLGEKDLQVRLMLKLEASVDAAQAMDRPGIAVGKHGWTSIQCPAGEFPEMAVLKAWVLESYRALCPRTILKRLDADQAFE